MAEDEGSKGKQLKPDSLVEHVDPKSPESAAGTQLAGFLGKSDREGYWRLYANLSLNDYFEIAEADVLNSQQVDPAVSPTGGTILWVRPDAQIVRKRVETMEARNAFLQGAITRSFLPQSKSRAPLISGGGGLGLHHTNNDPNYIVSHVRMCASHDPDDTVCTAQSERPGTADSCGMCSTHYNCLYGHFL